MDSTKRDKLIDSLYQQCQKRTATSKEVFDGLVKDLGLIGTEQIAEKAIEIIRPYKNTGSKLEATVEALYAVLYPSENSSSTKLWEGMWVYKDCTK